MEFLKFVILLLNPDQQGIQDSLNIRFTLKRILEIQFKFPTQSNITIPQIHQFIPVMYYPFARCWPNPKNASCFFCLDTCDAKNNKASRSRAYDLIFFIFRAVQHDVFS
jgi:hypothetical protein